MPQKSPFRIEIPACNILDYVFPNVLQPLDIPIWVDADDISNSLSPKQLLVLIKRFALGLDRNGIKQEEVAIMFSRNHIFVTVLYLGLAGSGRVFTACNPSYRAREFTYQLKDTDAKLILVEPEFLETVLEAAALVDFPRDQIYLFGDKPYEQQSGVKDWRTLFASEEEALTWKWPALNSEECKQRVAVLNYSSGTTGFPKGVMISHQNVIANVQQSLFMRRLETKSERLERWLGFLPLYHCFGQLWSITAAAINKTPVYYMRSFNFKRMLQHIQDHKITHLQTAPPVLVMLAKKMEVQKYDLTSLVNILCGAAPLSKGLQNAVSDRFGVTIVQTWGMTELTCSCAHTPGGRDDRTGSVGYLDPNCEFKLIDDNGKEVGSGQRGELCISGPNRSLGYHRNSKATAASIDTDGFLRSGDIAVRDDGGLLWIVDRKKELIKVNGLQVAPAELEALLLEHDYIADAAVVGVEVDHNQYPRAYVVLENHANGRLDEQEVQDWVNGQVAKHKRLMGGVKFIDAVPKSPSGKIQRMTLRKWAQADAAEKTRKYPRAAL